MTSNFFDYISWRGDLSFEADLFNKVDAAILAHLAYEHLEGLVSSSFDEKITIKELSQKFKESDNYAERIQMGFGIDPRTPEILFACGDSVRFGNLTVCGFKELLSEERLEQYASMVFEDKNTAYVAFRGTDDTIVGWCEDLLLACDPVLPSHKIALEYFNQVAASFKKNLVLLGHSKGGTLAVYSGTFANPKVQKRIQAIYNMDGPGWDKSFYETDEYKAIANKTQSVFPACDIVGRVFYHPDTFTIVKSAKKGIDQHNMLNWYCFGNDFIHVKDFTDDSKFFFKSVNSWFDRVDAETRKKFIFALINVYSSCGYKNNYDLNQNVVIGAKNMLSVFNKLDKETKTEIHNVMNVLGKVVVSELPFYAFLHDSKEFFNQELPETLKKKAKKVARKVKEAGKESGKLEQKKK